MSLDMKEKRISAFLNRKLFLALLLVYIALLFGSCVFFREPQEAIPRPGLFRSYRAAWNGGHLFPFAQNIILNMLLYTPIGFLLCGGLNKEKGVEKAIKTGTIISKENKSKLGVPLMALLLSILLGFTVSITIEHMQMQLHRGVYETDDVLNNTFGAFLGASWMIMHTYKSWRKKLIWVTQLFLAISCTLLLRYLWLCYSR